MRKHLWALAILFGCCAKKDATAPPPTPPPEIVYVVATPTQIPVDQIPPSHIAQFEPTPAAFYYPPLTSIPTTPTLPAWDADIKIEDLIVRNPTASGTVWFDGEARNIGSRTLRIKLQAKAYTANGKLIDSRTFYPERDAIPPGEAAHFNSFVEPTTGEEIYRVHVESIPR